MNLFQIRDELASLYNKLDYIRTRLTVLDNTTDEARQLSEPTGLLDEIENLIISLEDIALNISYRVNQLLGECTEDK